MKLYAVSLCVIALCSCGSDVASQKEAWKDYCHTYSFVVATSDTCKAITHYWCDDGANGYFNSPALASNYLGTECFRDQLQVYLYVCVIDETGAPQVRCNK